MANVLRGVHDLSEIIDTIVFKDEFVDYTATHPWTAVLTDTGSVAVAGVGGVVTLTPSDGSVADNDEAYLGTTLAFLKPAANKPLYAEALIQFTEANTSAANIAFGLASGVAADLIVDNGGGLRASGTVIAIYKVDGETVWRFVTRNGTNVTVSQSTKTAGGAAYQRLGIEILDVMGTTMTVVPTVDGQLLIDAATGQPIRHSLTLSGIAAAALVLAIKNGSTSLETLLCDYAIVAAAR